MSDDIQHLYKKYIKGTINKAPVENMVILVCKLTNAVKNVINCVEPKVYATSRMLKHLYDSKPAEEFEFLIRNIDKVTKYPDIIYKNKDGKRGDFGFVKEINNELYFCSLEIKESSDGDNGPAGIYIVTGFRIRKKNYSNGYELIWSWKGDNPSS